MKLIKGLAAAVLAFAVLGPATASAAQAAPVPVLYNDAAGWTYPTVRPAWIIIGQGGAPGAHTWHWSAWNGAYARSAGTLWVDSDMPNAAQGKVSYHHLVVTLSRVKYHDGRAYYSVMTWYTPGYRLYQAKTSTVVWHSHNGYWG